jgi:glycosyltransferase involved in cell wall biosynthesis
MKDKISIIIPVYNVEPYIRKCLDSVISQTYTNLEILLIDDGSIDSSGKICDEYAKKDNRIKVFHKTNGGVACARNVGLKNSTGDYLGFVDPDDWIEPNMYEVLYKALTENNVHLSATCYTRDTSKDSVIQIGREKIPNRILTQKEMLLYVFRHNYYAGFHSGPCNKLYRADNIKNNSLAFDESLKIVEDLKFITELILSENCKGMLVDKPLYHYLQRQDSLMRSYSLEKQLDRLRCLEETIKLAEKSGYSDIAVWQKRELCYSASLIAEKALVDNDKNLFEMMRGEMNVYIKEYIETNSEYPERIERINKLLCRI